MCVSQQKKIARFAFGRCNMQCKILLWTEWCPRAKAADKVIERDTHTHSVT